MDMVKIYNDLKKLNRSDVDSQLKTISRSNLNYSERRVALMKLWEKEITPLEKLL